MTKARLFLAMGAMLIQVSAQALELTSAVQYSAEYTTNTLRVEEPEIGEWIHQPGIDIVAQHAGPTYELDADYSYIRRIYQKDLWEDENRTVGSGTVRWFAIPQRLDFFIANSRSETTERTLEAETQANRQVTANTQAGSTLRFQPRPADELQFEYAYQDTRTNRTETNSSRHNGTARYLAGLSPNRSMNLVVSYSDINYDGLLPEAEFLIATIGYQQTSDALDLNVSIGHNWYKRDPLPTADDPTYNATLTWRAGGSTTISAEAFYGISDQSTSDTGNGNTGINAAFNETRGDLTLTQALGGRTNLTLGTFWGRQEYRIVPRDNESIGANIGLSRDLNRTTSVSIDASYQNRDFTDQVDDQDEWHGNVAVRHQIGRKLTFNWGVRYERREAVTTRNYEEWVGTLQLHYTFWGAGR